MYVCMYVCMCVCVCMYVCVRVCVCVCARAGLHIIEIREKEHLNTQLQSGDSLCYSETLYTTLIIPNEARSTDTQVRGRSNKKRIQK